MGEIMYWIVGFLWMALCLALGFYIRLRKGNGQFTVGLAAIFTSYLVGVAILVIALFV